jgi:hypothetical protein
MAGFGRSPFGRGPFGRSDVGRDLIIESFPVEYFDDSIELSGGETPKDNNKDPLLKLLKTYGFQVSNRRIEIDGMHSLLDPEEMPLEIVRLWGEMLGLGIDKNDPEFLQRSLLANASQWLQIKASIPGYEVRGLASGFTVTIENYWRIDPVYAAVIPARFLVYLRPKLADAGAVPILHASVPPGTYAGTPSVEDSTYAKSSYLRCIFEVAEPRRLGVDYNSLVDLVIYKIFDVVGIHHELLPSVFQIRLNVAAEPTTTWEIHESAIINASENYVYDITPADDIPTDHVMSVTMVVGDGIYMNADSAITVTLENDEQEADAVLPIPVGVNVGVNSIAEVTGINTPVSSSVNLVLATVMSIYVSPTVSFVIGITEKSTTYVIEASLSASMIIQETAKPAITETLNTSFSIDWLTKIGINVGESVSIFRDQEETKYWQINESVNTVFNLSESPRLAVDALTHFDAVPADVVGLDSSGYVTISITVGP